MAFTSAEIVADDAPTAEDQHAALGMRRAVRHEEGEYHVECEDGVNEAVKSEVCWAGISGEAHVKEAHLERRNEGREDERDDSDHVPHTHELGARVDGQPIQVVDPCPIDCYLLLELAIWVQPSASHGNHTFDRVLGAQRARLAILFDPKGTRRSLTEALTEALMCWCASEHRRLARRRLVRAISLWRKGHPFRRALIWSFGRVRLALMEARRLCAWAAQSAGGSDCCHCRHPAKDSPLSVVVAALVGSDAIDENIEAPSRSSERAKAPERQD